MTVSIGGSPKRVTIGTYKSGTTASSSSGSTLNITSGGISSGDIGRLVAVRPSGSDSSQTQVRKITAVSGGTITVHDDWVGTISSGVTWIVAHNAEDVYALSDSALEKVGDRSYRWAADWILSTGGFFGDTDISLEMTSQVTTGNFDAHWKCNPNSIVQFGLLWGGEANGATEVTNGCHISYQNLSGVLRCNIYNKDNDRDGEGAVINYYGCLINSVHADEELGGFIFMFQRMQGPTRFIGCIQDGTMGGRFYHEASEWVNSTVTGNINPIPAFSMGATFTRAIENLRFGQNLVAFKTFAHFSGTFRDCNFSDSNTDVIFADANNGSSVVNLIDCTTVSDADIIDSGVGTIAQFKSVNYTMTDDSGTALSGVALRVSDKDNTTQSSVQVSDGSGVCGEILARFREWVTDPPSTVYSPFDIRIRKYGYTYLGFSSAVSEPIKQEVRLVVNPDLVSNETQAQAIAGINLDFALSTLTISGSVTPQDLYDFYQYQLAQSANMQYAEDFTKSGSSFDLGDWNLVVDGCTYTGDITTSGTITRSNDGKIIGTATDANGTIVLLPWEVKNVKGTSRIQLVNVTKSNALVHTEKLNGTAGSFINVTGTYSDSQISAGDVIRLRVTCVVDDEAMLPVELTGVATSTGITFQIDQKADEVYNLNRINGSEVSKTLNSTSGTLLSDYGDPMGIDIDDSDGTASVKEIYAFFTYSTTTTDGVEEWFGGMTAINQNNYQINTEKADIKIQNVGSNAVVVGSGRLYRDDDKSVLVPGNGPITMDSGAMSINVQPQLEETLNANAKVSSINNNTKLIPSLL